MRSIELFAGCGGLALGMSRAGFQHEAVIELNQDAVVTLNHNRRRQLDHVKDWTIQQNDVRSIDYTKFEKIECVSGGPPCQPFSIGGKHLGPLDHRDMWPEVIRSIRELRPRVFVFENVRGLFRPEFAPYLEYIKLQLTYPDTVYEKNCPWEEKLTVLRQSASCGSNASPSYRVLAQTVNTADYGSAQKRHRAFFIGASVDLGDHWVFPKATHSQEALLWSQYVDGTYWRRHDLLRPMSALSKSQSMMLRRLLQKKSAPTKRAWRTVRDAIYDLPAPKPDPDMSGHWQHPGAKVYLNHTGSRYDEPAKALKSGNHGVPGGENMLVNEIGEVRYFTVREMARLHGFPDTFEFCGSWGAVTRQLGNAVPVSVAEVIGTTVMQLLV